MILSGTPAGVAASGKYPYLGKGDMIRIESEKIGKLENVVG
jgi:2-keto-4-pentenoate hydratase/2-oxohepta-3-ene-1,7-dioic acid hydratase in catechol pathway